MPKQPDRRRFTMWEKMPTRQPRNQRRRSAPVPVQPTASLIQPGYTDLGPRAPRPLRAPAYPLSSRPLLSPQATVQESFSQDTSATQPPLQTSPRQASPRPTLQAGPRRWARVRRLTRLFRLRRHKPITAQASPPTARSPPSISSPLIPLRSASVDLEHPRPAPVPPPPPPPSPIPSPSPSDETLLEPQSPLSFPPRVHAAHTPANRRPLSLPPPLRGARDPRDAEQYASPRPSLQLSRFALCQACSRVRHCMIGLGGGCVLCTECLRQHLIDGQD